MPALWPSRTLDLWRTALACYEEVVARQGVAKLPERDRWYRKELPAAIAARRPRHVTRAELIQLTEWKMSRGVWRAGNLVLVKSNAAADVRAATVAGLRLVPHPTAVIAKIAELAGVGPATASAVAAAAEPGIYPFFDELVAEQIPGLGKVAFTLSYYRRYAEQLRELHGRLLEG